MRRRFMMGQVYFSIDNYLTIETLEDNLTVKFSRTIEYGIDGKGWSILPKNTDSPPINIGQTMSFRANLIPFEFAGVGTFIISKKCNLKGNCMSMLFGDNAMDNYSLSGKDYAFCELFYNCSNIVTVSKNFLPATTLSSSCYVKMFEGCTNLTTAPELPATALTSSCYSSMFKNCTSLTTAPALPATTLTIYCYQVMFGGCTKLNYIKMLATDISALNCLYNWVIGVASTGIFVKNPAINSLSHIPAGWTVVNDGEEIGGGKIVNKGSIILYGQDSRWPYSCVFTYPVASNMEVICGDIVFDFKEGDLSSVCLSVAPMEELGESVKFYPSNEDDTYRYEVTINV